MTEPKRLAPKNSRLIAFASDGGFHKGVNIGFDSLTLAEKIYVGDIVFGFNTIRVVDCDLLTDTIHQANALVSLGRVSVSLAPVLTKARQVGHYDFKLDWAGENGYAHLILD